VSRSKAALGSLLFLFLEPVVVAGLVPWWLTGWEPEEPLQFWAPLRVVGGALVVAGTGVLLHAFARFVTEGRGTPAPVAPTETLVVGGLYRYVRNPMYLAVAATIFGQALLLGQLVLLAYGAVFLAVVAAFVHWYEEPTLSQTFGDDYAEYQRAVPRWLPRRKPWETRGPAPVEPRPGSDPRRVR
jgi:protein-S-isoprenylcysteine O-methyltransferase Ste14